MKFIERSPDPRATGEKEEKEGERGRERERERKSVFGMVKPGLVQEAQ